MRKMIVGYASTQNLDLDGDIITPRSWNIPTTIPLLLNHNPENKVGEITEVYRTKVGLIIKALIYSPWFETVSQMNGLSVGFVMYKASEKGGVRYISDAELREISVVKTPANDECRFTFCSQS